MYNLGHVWTHTPDKVRVLNVLGLCTFTPKKGFVSFYTSWSVPMVTSGFFLPLYFFSVGDGLQQRPGRNQATGQPPQGNVFRGNYLNKFVINNCIY